MSETPDSQSDVPGPSAIYQERIDQGELRVDPVQQSVIQGLQTLFEELMQARGRKKVGFFQRVTGLGKIELGDMRGVYMHGGVGRGKSMLMDLFFDCLPNDIRKTRVHFHQFMIDVHDYIHSRRESDGVREGVDATLPLLAERIAERSRVLCFDEFHVTDVADAMILGRLFTALFDRGVIVVATSNWEPDRLYEGGLQRDRFIPFIALLKRKMKVVHLDSPTDYRTETSLEEGSYFHPLNGVTKKAIDQVFVSLTDGAKPKSDVIKIKGRKIKVGCAANGVARFTFAQLCEHPHGAEDYIAIAERYETVFLEGIPKMGYDRRNEVKRLMNLIDALYEAHVFLVVSAQAPPERLYHGHDHSYEFERAISRLTEMQSLEYKEYVKD